MNTATAYIDAVVSAVPFGLAVLVILALVWAATKLFPAFGAWMNRPDEPKLTVADYEAVYDARRRYTSTDRY